MNTQTLDKKSIESIMTAIRALPDEPVGFCLTPTDMIGLALEQTRPEINVDDLLTHIESCDHCAFEMTELFGIAEEFTDEPQEIREQKLKAYLTNEIEQVVSQIQDRQSIQPTQAKVNKSEKKTSPLMNRLIEEIQDFTIAVAGFAGAHAKTNDVDGATAQELIRCYIETRPDHSLQIGLDSDAMGLEGIKLRLVDKESGWKSAEITMTRANEKSVQVGGDLFVSSSETDQWHDTPTLSLEIVADD